MRAKKVFETIDFQRGMDPKRAMGIGGRILYMDEVVTIPGEIAIKDPYDIRKFISNLHSGFYPSNLGIKGNGSIWTVDQIREKFDIIEFKGIEYKLG